MVKRDVYQEFQIEFTAPLATKDVIIYKLLIYAACFTSSDSCGIYGMMICRGIL
jgi:hypothetical protein